MGESGELSWSAGAYRRSAYLRKVELMFLGRYDHTIDEKGRITIPSRFRELLQGGGYLTVGLDKNLSVIPAPRFDQMKDRITALSFTDPIARLLRRKVFTSAALIEFDRAGRVLIPPALRQSAQLQENVIIAGTGDGFEIWAAELWAEQEAKLDDPKILDEAFSKIDLSLR